MNLSLREVRLFYKLHPALLCHVNHTLRVLPEQPATPGEFLTLASEERSKVRNVLWTHPQLIDQFVAANPFAFEEAELEIVRGWKHAVFGSFYVFRYLADYALFLSDDGDPRKAYGVVGLADHPENLLGPYLPRLVQTALMPFQGRIVYDGLLACFTVIFGGNVKRRLNEAYKEAKATFGVIVSLPFDSEKPTTALSKASKNAGRRPRNAATVRGKQSPAPVEARLAALNELTDSFCKEFLNDEYARLCRKLAAAMARKRPSPLLRGRLEPWASGIVRSIGLANFLGDPSQTPHMKAPCIDRAFGVRESTGQAKARAIREMFNIHPLAPQWTLPSRIDDNPLVWAVEVNGLILDMRRAPREYQEAAFRKGLIPYIPADRTDACDR